MFKIGEFSKLTQVSIRMLRYYDEKGLLKPAQIDKFTGYRMYSADQIPLLQKIILLKDLNFSTLEIGEAIVNWNNKNISKLLTDKKIKIKEDIDEQINRMEKIDRTLEHINKKNKNAYCNINFKTVESMKILSIRQKLHCYFDEHILWEKLCLFINKEKISVKQGLYNNISIYHDIEHKDENVDVEVGIVVDELGENKGEFVYRETEKIEKMAFAMVEGPYNNLSDAYKSLAYWIEKNNETMLKAPSRQICHIGMGDVDKEENYLTEIQIPLKSNK